MAKTSIVKSSVVFSSITSFSAGMYQGTYNYSEIISFGALAVSCGTVGFAISDYLATRPMEIPPSWKGDSIAPVRFGVIMGAVLGGTSLGVGYGCGKILEHLIQ